MIASEVDFRIEPYTTFAVTCSVEKGGRRCKHNTNSRGWLRGNILYVVIRCRDALTSDRRGSGFAEVFRLTLSNTRTGAFFFLDKKICFTQENHTATYYFHKMVSVFFFSIFFYYFILRFLKIVFKERNRVNVCQSK